MTKIKARIIMKIWIDTDIYDKNIENSEHENKTRIIIKRKKNIIVIRMKLPFTSYLDIDFDSPK